MRLYPLKYRKYRCYINDDVRDYSTRHFILLLGVHKNIFCPKYFHRGFISPCTELKLSYWVLVIICRCTINDSVTVLLSRHTVRRAGVVFPAEMLTCLNIRIKFKLDHRGSGGCWEKVNCA